MWKTRAELSGETRAVDVGCRRCNGSGVHTFPKLTARVCGSCNGRGYHVPREVSTGSWFEPRPGKPKILGRILSA